MTAGKFAVFGEVCELAYELITFVKYQNEGVLFVWTQRLKFHGHPFLCSAPAKHEF